MGITQILKDVKESKLKACMEHEIIKLGFVEVGIIENNQIVDTKFEKIENMIPNNYEQLINRIENKNMPLLYYIVNRNIEPSLLNFPALWKKGQKIYNKKSGHYFLEEKE